MKTMSMLFYVGRRLRRTGVFGLVLLPVCASADTIALYTFEGGTAGEAVTTVRNAVNPGVYDATAKRLGSESDGYGDAPCYTNNFPGMCVFSDSACTQMLARAPMAVHFSKSAENANVGSCLEIPGIAADIWNDSFTVECFWRSASESTKGSAVACMSYGRRIFMQSGESYKNCVRMDTHVKSTNDKNISFMGDTSNRYLTSYGWRHWAMVFDKDTATATFWFDYDNYGEVSATTYYAGSSLVSNLRFGACIPAGQTPDPNIGKGCSVGEIACIRVSNRVLGKDDFMQMGVNAFYPFKDGAAGTVATTVTNALVEGEADGVAGTFSSKVPQFSSDRPGRYVFSSSRKDKLLCEEPGSLLFKNSSSVVKGYVAVTNLAGQLLMTTREKQGATFECFFKRGTESWGNLDVFSFKAGGKVWRLYSDEKRLVSSEQDFTSYAVVKNTEGESLANDGRWHHLAVVVEPNLSSASTAKQWKKVTVYLDYAKTAGSVRDSALYWNQETFWNSPCIAPFCIGNSAALSSTANGFQGNISAVRVVSKPLSPEEFMVASDTMDAPSVDGGFRWRFEEGTPGATVSSVPDQYSREKWAVGELTRFGASVEAPVYSRERPARIVKIGDVEYTNTVSSSFVRNASTNRVALETRTWHGMPALHPESWTMEMFVKTSSSAPRAADALLAGRGRINVSTGAEWYDWVLAVQPNGKLALKGFREDETEGSVAFAYSDAGASLDDDRWHSVVVMYDGSLKNYGVWVDGARVLDETLGSAQVDSSDARYQLGHGCGLEGFSGLIDEVRFVGRVLSADELATLKAKGFVLSCR